jgi:hypothetical protein
MTEWAHHFSLACDKKVFNQRQDRPKNPTGQALGVGHPDKGFDLVSDGITALR